MSSKVNEALFELIKSMSKSEKRYFKLMSSRHTIGQENNYVRLFDYLDKQTDYNEDMLKIDFQGEPLLNRLSITKKRLYDHILTSLDSFHSVGSLQAQLQKMLHSADILYEKSLYDQSRRILVSAEKLAFKHDKHEILLLIYRKQNRLHETNGYFDFGTDSIEEMVNKEDEAIKAIQLHNYIWTIKTRLFMLLSKRGIVRREAEMEDYKKICAELLSPSLNVENGTMETKYLYNHTLSAYYYAVGDFTNSFSCIEKVLLLFENKDYVQTIEPNKKMSVLTNAIYIANLLGHHKQSSHYLVELKNWAKSIDSNEDLSIKLFSSIASIEFSLCLKKGDFIAAQKISEDVEQKLEEYGEKIIPIRRAFLEFKMAVVYMSMGDFSTALKWVNRILNNPNLDKTEDIIGFTQLLDLLIHIELNHKNLLPYSLKSTQRFFKTRNRLYSFEKVFLQFIGKLIKAEDQLEMESLWEDLYNDLAGITDDSFESVALEYFDFRSWAEAKLKRKPFDMVIKEKYFQKLAKAS